MPNENGTTYSVLEDLLFARRLERTLRIQHERLNNLMKEQIELLERRQQLLCSMHQAVREVWEPNPAPELAAPLTASEEAQNGE